MIRAAINIVAAVSIANVALAADQEIVSTNQFTTLGVYSNGASITARANQQSNSDYFFMCPLYISNSNRADFKKES